MPITTRVAPVEVKPAPPATYHDAETLLRGFSPDLCPANDTSMIDSSIPDGIHIGKAFDQESYPQLSNGFIGTLLDAYRKHNHVVLRPEDVWLAILTQFSYYVNRHAEKLRSHFVNHGGKKKLELEHLDLNMPIFLAEITGLLHQNIKDPLFHDWIMPSFTTTTEDDKLSAAIIMMGTLQKYFAYFDSITCGIPSVTLLGEESDWEDILIRIEYLSTFAKDHPQIAIWQSALKGMVRNMVQTFRAPDSPDVVRFWQRAVHSYKDDYYGDKRITGWILAFTFWDTEGKLLSGQRLDQDLARLVAKDENDWWSASNAFHFLEWHNVPSGIVHVPVHINDRGDKYVAKAITGCAGYTIRDSEEIFKLTRQRGKRGVELSGDTLGATSSKSPARVPGFLKKLTQVLLCPRPAAQSAPVTKEVGFTTKVIIPEDAPPPQRGDRYETEDPVPQLSDLTELGQSWAYEEGGKGDTLQPVTSWWVIRTSEGQYGRDPDVPHIQFDRDANDYDKYLAENGEPMIRTLGGGA